MTNSDDGETNPGVQPGEVLAGKYRVERILGAGGMGVVVAAHHIQLDEKVALKFLLPDALKNAEALARFEREARAAVKIKSEHVARVSDVGKLDSGAPYMVMEYLEGGDLSGMLAKLGKLAPEQAVDFIMQACEAIAEAHSLGIVHRDLKPANLFCIRRRDGQLSVKVLDFGISKVTGGAGGATANQNMAMTKTTAVIGSPVYMSPEQMQSSKGVDLRTDIWSMGVILYELLTGRLPFDAGTVTELAIKVATEEPPSMSDAPPPGLPEGLEQVVLHCLVKDREMRFQSIAELAEALAPFGTARSQPLLERIQGMVPGAERASVLDVASSPSLLATTGPRRSGGTAAPWQTSAKEKKGGGKGAVVGIAVGAVVLLAAGGGFFMLRKSPASPPAAAAAAIAPPAPPPVVAPAPAPSPAASVVQAAAAAPSAAAGPSAAPAAPAPAQHHAAAPAHPAAAPAPAPAAKTAHCNPPYYFDASGNRVFKKECL